MGTYKVTDPTTGRTFRLTGDSPPTEKEIMQVIESSITPPKVSYPESVKQNIRDTGSSILEEGGKLAGQVGAMGIGAMKGAAYGAPYGPYGMIAGGILGGAAGYATVESADRLRRGERLTAGTLAEDIGTGVLTETGGQSVGGAVKLGREAIAKTNLPRDLYASAIKTPLSGNWKKVLPGRDYSMRELTAITGLTEQQIVNKEAPALIQQKINNLTGQVDSLVKDLTKAGEKKILQSTELPVDQMTRELAEGGKVPGPRYSETEIRHLPTVREMPQFAIPTEKPGPFMTPVSDVNVSLGPLKARSQASDPSALSQITEIEQRAIKVGGVKSSLTPEQLNMLKQQAQADINWDRAKPILQPNGRFREDALRAVANRSMELLEEMDPTIKYLNKKAAAYIDLKTAVENTLARQWNKDIVPATSKMLALGHMGLAALDTVMSFPSVRSRLAIALGRASGLPANATGRAAALAARNMQKD